MRTLLLLVLPLLAACATTAPRVAESSRAAPRRGEARDAARSPAPMQASEVPLEDLPGEEGLASFYSDRLAGRLTANGERYDPERATCAHKKLRFGTRVRVVDLETGREVRCVINDRGPFVAGRIIDLSKRLARELDLLERGLTRVKVIVEDEGGES